MSKSETDPGQVLKVFRMWESNFPRFLLRCMFRALIKFSLYVVVILFVIIIFSFIPVFAKLFNTDDQRLFFLPVMLPAIYYILVDTCWAAADRIIVRERGLEIYLSSVFSRSHHFLAWDDMTSIGLREIDPGFGEGEIDYCCPTLYMNRWPHNVEIWEIIHIPVSDYTTSEFLRGMPYKFINPDKFVKTGFGHYVQTYAPHVIEKLREEQNRVMQLARAS